MKTMIGALLTSIIAVSIAKADVTGPYDGQMTGATPIAAAVALSQTGVWVTGTLALDAGLASFGGAYTVTGRATAKKLKLSGVGPNGARLSWKGKIATTTISGKARLKVPGNRLAGLLSFTRNVSTEDGSTCDTVYNQNSTAFGQVLSEALMTCAACHVTGGQAQATRLHVTSSDPLATARQVALLVDSTNPSTSRILEKPLQLLPHGGGQQITAGSAEEQVLTEWVDLIAQAHCN